MPTNEKGGEPLNYVPGDSEVGKSEPPRNYVLNIETGKYTVTVGLVTAVSTTANASFDKLVSVFKERIQDSAAKILGEKSIPDEPSAEER